MKLQPSRGGFLRPFGCGEFIRDYLSGRGPNGSGVDPGRGAPQADIFSAYKSSLLKAMATDRATKEEERTARREGRLIDPERIEVLAEGYLERMPYKAHGMRYHSFLMYFGVLKKLGWVQPTGEIERSALQDYYEEAPSRMYYVLTGAGMGASDAEWKNPLTTLYPHLGVSHNLR